MVLVVIACLLSAPEDCRDHRLQLTISGRDAGQCMYSSPPRIARWQVMHPKWRVKSWRCVLLGEEENV